MSLVISEIISKPQSDTTAHLPEGENRNRKHHVLVQTRPVQNPHTTPLLGAEIETTILENRSRLRKCNLPMFHIPAIPLLAINQEKWVLMKRICRDILLKNSPNLETTKIPINGTNQSDQLGRVPCVARPHNDKK